MTLCKMESYSHRWSFEMAITHILPIHFSNGVSHLTAICAPESISAINWLLICHNFNICGQLNPDPSSPNASLKGHVWKVEQHRLRKAEFVQLRQKQAVHVMLS